MCVCVYVPLEVVFTLPCQYVHPFIHLNLTQLIPLPAIALLTLLVKRRSLWFPLPMPYPPQRRSPTRTTCHLVFLFISTAMAHPGPQLIPLVPFKEEDSQPLEPWLPFTPGPDDRYAHHRTRFASKLSLRSGSRAVEDLAASSFKSMVVTSLNGTKPSGVWDSSLANHRLHVDLYRYISSYYDINFIQITRRRPDEAFYIKLLALRNTLLELWLTKGKRYSTRTTLLLTVLSNGLQVLDLRFLALQKNTSKLASRRLLAACHTEITDILTRPEREFHKDRVAALYNFIQFQAHAVTGRNAEQKQYIYVIVAATSGYIGRTSGNRTRVSFSTHGFTPRWTEHVRELHSTINSTVLEHRKGNRYVQLTHPHVGPGLGIIAIASYPEYKMTKMEAVGIAVSQFPANGAQSKHLVEQVRHSTKKPDRPNKGANNPRNDLPFRPNNSFAINYSRKT